MPRTILALAALAIVVAGCDKKPATTTTTGGCDPSIKLPPGFCATIFADSAGPARHLVVRKNGDVIVGILDQRRETGGVLMLRDSDKDGHADQEARFGESGVHGVVLEGDSTLLVSTATDVLRYRLSDSLGPKKRIDTVITGLATGQFTSHSPATDV